MWARLCARPQFNPIKNECWLRQDSTTQQKQAQEGQYIENPPEHAQCMERHKYVMYEGDAWE